ncbi:hypothetical protein H4219_000456 [Mycoemilia scoparia]|uniref:Uncharacterized protein n=1 Tax=Mycoemilia scoparia TaxID=417184 RepID=A0A9W8A5V2_9FUNG|nr:hypothetical protein H4219_000456 [Mycoemilia scoparia]
MLNRNSRGYLHAGPGHIDHNSAAMSSAVSRPEGYNSMFRLSSMSDSTSTTPPGSTHGGFYGSQASISESMMSSLASQLDNSVQSKAPTYEYSGFVIYLVSFVAFGKGRVFAMGWGADGQIGTGPNDMDDKDIPTLVSGLDGVNIKKISTSTDFTLALSDENQVFFWGNGEYGQFPTSDENFIDRIPEATLMPSPVEGKLIDIAAGGTFSAFLSDNGYVYVCGYGAVGMGQNNTLSVNNYTAIPSLSDIVAIRASTDYMVALDAEKRVFVWGFNSLTGRLGTGNIENVHEPTQLKLPEHINAPNNLNSLSLGTQLALWALN